MSETRPLLLSSPRDSFDGLHLQYSNGSSASSGFGFIKSGFAKSGSPESNKDLHLGDEYGSNQAPPETNGKPLSEVNGKPAVKRLYGIGDTCKYSTNDQDRRVWISADNPDKSCGHEHRTLVLCFDGTGDQFDDDNSNIVELLAMLRKDDNSRQLVYYQAGLGTYTDPLLKSPIVSAVSMTLDQMLAWNLASHVKDGYAFLMQNYTRGDKICIFGFSRGAYTARALAGMLQKVGLLPVCNHQQLPFAWDMYKREDKQGLDLSHDFKKTYCRTVSVDFLGVWDTVASVGLFPRYLPFIHENTGVRHLRHGIALDERRVKFLPQFCADAKPEDGERSHKLLSKKHPEREGSLLKTYESLINRKHGEESDVKEVWFAGVHCDVGGGAVANYTPYKLSRIPLRWMIRECFECNTGIVFDARMLQKAGLPVYRGFAGMPTLAPLYKWIPAPPSVPIPVVRKTFLQTLAAAICYPFALAWGWIFAKKEASLPPPPPQEDPYEYDLEELPADYEYRRDLEDSKTNANDEYDKKALWAFLDWTPQRVKKQKAIINKLEDGDSYKWLWNRGSGRKIPKTETAMDKDGNPTLLVHRSVKMRLEALDDYAPRVRPMIDVARHKENDPNGPKMKEPRRMTHAEWNVEKPKFWKWVE
ncbi:hypothetical protein PHLCEN_2v8948 [Hermanssonia centrifuga]|uniref:T6SS Phospholipase effector Tle1-like catalytic domain-containing protein n=1 Tax=Hermanssonia centrifuga TaxID=98765 RepID=A0A2R6NS15_9APHY|nr:hypothetical protein PHLCEN_2v8948 [Hermanssonia centrifuga]